MSLLYSIVSNILKSDVKYFLNVTVAALSSSCSTLINTDITLPCFLYS